MSKKLMLRELFLSRSKFEILEATSINDSIHFEQPKDYSTMSNDYCCFT